MDVSRNGGDIAFRTPFSPQQDLVQILSGVEDAAATRNNPVDFRLAGLQRRGHRDIWHVDQVLAYSTDECSPMVVNGEDIGGNHGHPCAVRVESPDHGKDCRDVGSLWQDERGLRWTLLRVESKDRLLMLSENIGPSLYAYDFANAVAGDLSYVENGLHTELISVAEQTGEVQLTPAIRHLQREAVVWQDGRWRPAGGWHENCERAEIREVYEIINPATVAPALRANRPAGGYTAQPSLAVGESMMLHRMTYRIDGDGTILCDFRHELTQPVHMPWYLGIMHQEKCDVFGGGVWRYIPGLKPFTDRGAAYDFSRPYNTTQGPMPRSRSLTPDLWTDPYQPPSRQIDYIRRADGSCGAAFASGFLPLYDGAPDKRRAQITDTGDMVDSRKTYPTFAGGKDQIRHLPRESAEGAMHFPALRGIAYKKYYLPDSADAGVYTVNEGDTTYVYMDFHAPEERAVCRELLPGQCVQLLDSAGISWQQEGTRLTARGRQGYAVFCVSAAKDERG